jgi:hypothetical protein
MNAEASLTFSTADADQRAELDIRTKRFVPVRRIVATFGRAPDDRWRSPKLLSPPLTPPNAFRGLVTLSRDYAGNFANKNDLSFTKLRSSRVKLGTA